MPPPLLYSTNVFLKFHIQQQFRDDVHYVWCSENFDATTQPRYSSGSLVAPSSNPADIFKQLRNDVERKDWHSYKISQQKASLKALAINWESNGEITLDDKEEIIYLLDHVSFDYWRPLIYIVPRTSVDARLKAVHVSKRASLGMEWIVEDLQRSEFDVIEL